jgi:hypothetical protein
VRRGDASDLEAADRVSEPAAPAYGGARATRKEVLFPSAA